MILSIRLHHYSKQVKNKGCKGDSPNKESDGRLKWGGKDSGRARDGGILWGF